MRRRKPRPSPEAAALAEARWTAADLLSRRSAAVAPDLLRGRAAELTGSGRECDRLLAAFLERAANDIEQGRAPLQEPAGPGPAEGRPARRRDPGLWWWVGVALLAALGAGLLAAAG